MAFTVSRRTALAPEAAWSALTDLAEHTRHVPLTDVEVPAGGLRARRRGRRLDPARPARGRRPDARHRPSSRAAGCAWSRPAGSCAAGPTSASTPDPVAPGGSLVSWTEELWLPGLRRVTRPAGDRLGAVLFSRVVDGAARPRGRRWRERAVTWAVLLAVLGSAVVVAAAWLLGRPGPRRAPRRRSVRLAGCRRAGRAGPPTAGGDRASRPRCAATGWTRSTPCSTRSRPASPRTTARSPGCGATVPGRPRRAAGPVARRRRRSARRTGAAHRAARARGGEDEPPPRPGPAAGRDEAPAAGRPAAAAPVGPLGPAGLPPRGRLGARPG